MLSNQKFHYNAHKIQVLKPILNDFNQFHTYITILFMMHLNVSHLHTNYVLPFFLTSRFLEGKREIKISELNTGKHLILTSA
jgi:hypothetical protein